MPNAELTSPLDHRPERASAGRCRPRAARPLACVHRALCWPDLGSSGCAILF